MIHQPKKTILQFPGLWLPGSPLPGAVGFGRRCCCGEEEVCQACLNSPHPAELFLTLLGVVNGSTCTDCNEFDNTWTIAKDGEAEDRGTSCRQKYESIFTSVTTCERDEIRIQIFVIWQPPAAGASIRTIAIQLWTSLGPTGWGTSGAFLLREFGESDPFNCDTFVNLDIPNDGDSTSRCDADSATCKLNS